MHALHRPDLARRFKRMFTCDSVRISKPMDTMFLILGWTRNTKDDSGQWVKNGRPVHFDYMNELVIASGKTDDELIASAKFHKKLEGMSMAQFLKQPEAFRKQLFKR